MIEPLGDQDNGFAAFVHSLGYAIQENLTHNLQQGAKGVSQRELAKLLEVSRWTIQQVDR